jgi:hypothetical protein
LKCCLNYELDTYLDALQHFPDNCDTLQVAKGNAFLIKKDIFKNLMWYTLPDTTKQYPLTIERVRKIKTLNMQGVIPDELEAVDLLASKPKETATQFVELVGQISLQSLEKADRKRKQQQKSRGQQRPQQGQGGQRNQPQQGGRPPQRNQPRSGPGQQQRNPPQGQQKGRPPQPNKNQPRPPKDQ